MTKLTKIGMRSTSIASRACHFLEFKESFEGKLVGSLGLMHLPNLKEGCQHFMPSFPVLMEWRELKSATPSGREQRTASKPSNGLAAVQLLGENAIGQKAHRRFSDSSIGLGRITQMRSRASFRMMMHAIFCAILLRKTLIAIGSRPPNSLSMHGTTLVTELQMFCADFGAIRRRQMVLSPISSLWM